MYGEFESAQYAEVNAKDDGHEAEFLFTLNCTFRGHSAQAYGPPEDCYPAEAAEFELDTIHVLDAEHKPVPISYQILEAFVSKETAQKMLEDAETEALESGDF